MFAEPTLVLIVAGVLAMSALTGALMTILKMPEKKISSKTSPAAGGIRRGVSL